MVTWCQAGRMPPAIRYCTTPAGRIAYCATGSGPPLLLDPGWVSHVGRQLELFSFGAFVAGLAERFTVIRYDKPGCGLSDRDAGDLSFDTQVAAALAVADAARADRFRLFGASQGGQLAAAIAARYPERVEALVLYGTCADGRDLAPAQVRESIVALMRAHWGLGSKVLAGIFVPGPSAAEVEALTLIQREGASAAVAGALLEDVLRYRCPAAAPGDHGPDRGAAPGGGSGHRVRAGARGGRPDPGRHADPAAGHEPPVLPRGVDRGAGRDARVPRLAARPSRRPSRRPSGGGGAGPRLTGRELEVARLIAQGLTNYSIGLRLSIAPRTAETHVENIMRKLGVRSRAQIATWVTEQRLPR